MIRGIEFQIPSDNGKYLFNILEKIDLDTCHCYVEFNEIYRFDGDQNLLCLLDKNFYQGNELKKIIRGNEYIVIFLELFIYQENKKFKEIQTYDDFTNSECEMILLIADSSYATLYHKNKSILNSLYKQFRLAGYSDISYIDENDSRYRMSVT